MRGMIHSTVIRSRVVAHSDCPASIVTTGRHKSTVQTGSSRKGCSTAASITAGVIPTPQHIPVTVEESGMAMSAAGYAAATATTTTTTTTNSSCRDPRGMNNAGTFGTCARLGSHEITLIPETQARNETITRG